MVLVYVNLIMKGLWDLDNVPDIWRADVEIKLEELKPVKNEEIVE